MNAEAGLAAPTRRPQLRVEVPKHEQAHEAAPASLTPTTPIGTPLSADKAELRRRLLMKQSPTSAPVSPYIMTHGGDGSFTPCFNFSHFSASTKSVVNYDSYRITPPGSPIAGATSMLNGPFDSPKRDPSFDSRPQTPVLKSDGSDEAISDNDAASVLFSLWHSPPPMGSPAVHSSLVGYASPLMSPTSSSSLKRSASQTFDDESELSAQLKHANKKDNRIPNSCESHKRRHLRCPIDCPERSKRSFGTRRFSTQDELDNDYYGPASPIYAF